jgi:redox-regulated HSP33 family molecular chaperone
MLEEKGEAELVCHFCASRYRFDAAELAGLLKESVR